MAFLLLLTQLSASVVFRLRTRESEFAMEIQSAKFARFSAASKKRVALLASLLLCGCWSGLGAQETPPATQDVPIIRSSTRLVVLDVVVSDAHGRPVHDLSAQDFHVLEDGVEQKIASFESPSRAGAHNSGAPAGGVTPGRSGGNAIPSRNILVLDELNTEVLDEAYSRQSIDKYLRKHGPTLEQPTSLLIVGQDHLEFAHDYTRDAGALRLALHGHHSALPFEKDTGGDYNAVDRFSKSLWVLKQIASANLHYAGRKNVIWIGAGFEEFTGRTLAYQDKKKFMDVIREMADVLFEARIAIYTINPEGLQVSPTEGIGSFGDLMNSELVFEGLALQTGGKIIRGRNELDGAIAETIEDGASYYTMSYSPVNRDWNGEFRNISVTANGTKLQVRARKGYYALAESPLSPLEVDDRVSQALMSPLPFRALDVQAAVTSAESGTGKYILNVNPNGLEWKKLDSGKWRCQVTAVTATMGAGTQFATHNVRELEAILDAQQYKKAFSKPVAFNLVAELPSDTRFVKVVVRDSSNGNIGTAEIQRGEIRAR